MNEEFTLENGSPIPGHLRLDPSGHTGKITIFGEQVQTKLGEIIERENSKERFFLLDHDLNGTFFRPRPHWSAGVLKVNAIVSVWRLNGTSRDSPVRKKLAEDVPAVLEVIRDGKYRISVQRKTNLRQHDRLVIETLNGSITVMVTALESMTWDGALTVASGITDSR